MVRFLLALLVLSFGAPAFAAPAGVPFAGRNIFEIFGVDPREADQRGAFKASYRKLAKLYHPDRNIGDKRAEAAMKRVNELMAELEKAQFRAELVKVEGLAPVKASAHRQEAPSPPKAESRAKPEAKSAAPESPSAKPAAQAPAAGPVHPAARAYGAGAPYAPTPQAPYEYRGQYEEAAKRAGSSRTCPGMFARFTI
jgi:curved DNA-binding protein CbpA